MFKKIAWGLASVLLLSLLLLNEGVRNEIEAHSNRFRSIIIYGSSGITNAGTLTTGSAGSGTDVTFYSGTSGDDFLWDASEEQLNITGTNNQDALVVDDGDVNIYDNMTVSGAINFLADTSATNDTYGGTIDPPLQAWNTGTLLIMTVGQDNTGACTVAPDGLAAKSVKTASGANPANSDLVTTTVSILVYDGTNLLLVNPATTTD